MGIYSLQAGGLPQRISQPIESLLKLVNTGTYTVRLIWDDRFQGLHVFVTYTASQSANQHFFYEARTGAWWQDTFANQAHNPLCVCTLDGNLPTDRVALIGSWDGYVRYLNPAATTDDGSNIIGEVVIGPILTKDMDEVMLHEIQAVMSENSGSVTFRVYVGNTAEAALASAAVVTGTWASSRNLANFVRRAGHAIYVRISATTPWAMESIRCRIESLGKVRRRGK